MKTTVLLTALTLSIGLVAQTATKPVTTTSASSLTTTTKKAFARGEKVTYRVHYGVIDAGEATIEVKNEVKVVGGRNTYHVVGTGKSLGAFNYFYKVNDRYETFIDEEKLYPWLFIRRVNEGGFIINQDYVFNQNKNLVKYTRTGTDQKANGTKVVTTKPGMHDIISATYYARNKDMSKLKVGDKINVTTFFDEEEWPLAFKFLGKETIKTKYGKIACLKFTPMVQKGRVFKEQEEMILWISDDANHLPIRLEAKILVGSVKMDIKEYSGLATPLTIIK